MTERDETGYGESPDTSDGPVGESQADDGTTGGDSGTELTTDPDAQRDDSMIRPGNEPD